MENKLTWVELKKVVARQTGLNEKEVNQILSIWLDEMTAALKRGEDLHINGLGTFRMKKMKERKSVNVTTGESIILPETDRLTFMMAAGLEEQLRDDVPARLEVGIDPIKKLSAQADEIVGLLGELGQSPDKRLEVRGEEPQPQPKEEKEEKKEKKEKKSRLWLTALITILVFFLVIIGLFFFFQSRLERWLGDMRARAAMVEVVSESVSESESESVSESEKDSIIVMDSVVMKENVSESESERESESQPISKDMSIYRTYNRFITVERMHANSRLTWMAYRYYGKKELWVFIYDANRDRIANPENIKVGTPVRVPKLRQEVIDLASPELQVLVKDMTEEFLGDR